MRTLFSSFIALSLVLGAAGCGGKSKNHVGAPAPEGSSNATGGSTYGGATYGNNPCGAAKSDPCGGGE